MQRLPTETQHSVIEMDLCNGEGLPAPILLSPVEDKGLMQTMEGLQHYETCKQKHNQALYQTLMEIKNTIKDGQEHGSCATYRLP